jgi:Fur family transcriptional regulator, ferric uptake regulator
MICKEHQAVFKKALRAGRLKATPKRLAMLEVFAHNSKPMSIAGLSKKISDQADIATLYRNVESMAKLNLLNRLRLGDKKDYYEYAQKLHHHHLVCLNCGKLSDVDICKAPQISGRTLSEAGFAKLNSHQLEFFGICKQCNN